MRAALNWSDYELLDCSDGERLERWGKIILIRPDPQIIWKPAKTHPGWAQAHARYHRSTTGGGSWQVLRELPPDWEIAYDPLRFRVKTMGFKHTGLFPEQAVNWDYLRDKITRAARPVRALNLFAYTGGATMAMLAVGAQVVHVDSAKGMVAWAKENQQLSALQEAPVRYMVDDCIKFVQREIRRGNRYDILVMDPPSYGRGPSGEIWKLEEQIDSFLALCLALLSEQPLLVLLNSYTTGLSPAVMEYLLKIGLQAKRGGRVWSDELGLPVTQTGGILPCGASAIWESE